MERIGSQIGGFSREWVLFPAPVGAPLVVFLTGTGGTALWADRETGWSELAAREGFTLLIPEALPPNPAATPSFLANPPRWNDGSPHPFDGPQPDDVAFLTTVIDDTLTRTGADPRAVFVTGFSNGAGMAFRLTAERAERIAAVAPVAGHCWVPDPKPSQPVPTLYTVGMADLLIPFRGGDVRLPWNSRLVRRPPVTETLERWAVALGCAPIPVPPRNPLVGEGESGGQRTVRVDRYPGPVPFDAVIIDGLGHHWPGGRAQLNPRTAGPPSNAVNATEMIWAFFKQHV